MVDCICSALEIHSRRTTQKGGKLDALASVLIPVRPDSTGYCIDVLISATTNAVLLYMLLCIAT